MRLSGRLLLVPIFLLVMAFAVFGGSPGQAAANIPVSTETLNVNLCFGSVVIDANFDGVPETTIPGPACLSGPVTVTGGPASVDDGEGDGLYEVNTEITSGLLHGVINGDPVTMKSGAGQGLSPTLGKTEQQVAGPNFYPASNFFDIFFEIDSTVFGTLRNCNNVPLHDAGVQTANPPVGVSSIPGSFAACEGATGGGPERAIANDPQVTVSSPAAVGGEVIANVNATDGGGLLTLTIVGALAVVLLATGAGTWYALRRRLR